MRVLTDGRLPVKCWASSVEDGALEQARNLANLEVNLHHVALMPDAHQGYGMPIGGVIFTDGAVIPNAVGVDIGCGVALLETNLTALASETLRTMLDGVAARVPTGFRRRTDPLSEAEAFEVMGLTELPASVRREWWEGSLDSLGTLGGGNHFIEFQSDESGRVYVMLHSGSRGLGKKIGDHYHKLAVELCARWHTALPTTDLAYFPFKTDENRAYTEAMNFGLQYAETNRCEMLDAVKFAIADVLPDTVFRVLVNVHHNYAAWEHHFGENGVVHRKGAIRARVGEMLLIPGSMGTSSYIGEGLGNRDSYNTCQHGAGRAMGRKDAERRYAAGALENLGDFMGSRNILMAGHASEAIDEHPGAYKDIEQVMLDSADLVKPLHRMTPLGVVKG